MIEKFVCHTVFCACIHCVPSYSFWLTLCHVIHHVQLFCTRFFSLYRHFHFAFIQLSSILLIILGILLEYCTCIWQTHTHPIYIIEKVFHWKFVCILVPRLILWPFVCTHSFNSIQCNDFPNGTTERIRLGRRRKWSTTKLYDIPNKFHFWKYTPKIIPK